VQKCAFTCAGLSDDGDHFAALDLEVEAGKEVERAAGGLVDLLEIGDLDKGGLIGRGLSPRL
jgi:hypothetical protein